MSVQAARSDGASSEVILVLDCFQPPSASLAFPSQLLLLQRLLGCLSVHVRLVGSSVPVKCSGAVLTRAPSGTAAPRTGPGSAVSGSTKIIKHVIAYISTILSLPECLYFRMTIYSGLYHESIASVRADVTVC